MELCQDTVLPKPGLHLPRFEAVVAPEGVSLKQGNKGFMLDLMERGLVARYGEDLSDEVMERAEFEFRAIADAFGPGERGLEDYFLITWDWVDWCHRHNIMTGPGRGSAAGSILAYALGITHVDPLKYDLYFERFWNPGRTAGLPDIDVDVPQGKRDEVKRYLVNRWGEDHVRDIGTHIRMQPKSAIDATMKALMSDSTGQMDGIHYKNAAIIKKIIEKTEDAGQSAPWHSIKNEVGDTVIEGVWDLVGDELQPIIDENEDYADVFQVAEHLTGRIASYGVHPSAVIISDIPLTDTLPGRMVKGKKGAPDRLVTQVEMKEVEKEGFLKADVLGLRNLDTLTEVLRLVPEHASSNPNDVYKSIDLDTLDPGCYELLTNKLTRGLFQIENGHSARKIAKDMEPNSIEDLAAIVALNRPGPLRSGMADRYFARRSGEEPVVYQHEILADILDVTYGDFLYQEQVLAYFRKIGYTLGEADDIRRMLGKKQVEKMSKEKPRYLARASEFMKPEIAEAIWDEIIGFSKYSFNKSHAVAYAVVLAWTMWAKFHYPTEFIMASITTNIQQGVEVIGAYVTEGRRMGVQIVPPDINRSQVEITKDGEQILFGLMVKGVGDEAAEWLVQHRPFENFEQALEKVESENKLYKKLDPADQPAKSPKQRCGKGAFNSLLNVGAFDNLHGGAFLQVTKEDVPQVRDPSKTSKKDVVSLCSVEDRAAYEKDLMGVTLTDVWSDIVANLDMDQFDSYASAEENEGGVRLIGVISEIEKRKMKEGGYNAGATWAFVTIEWQGETTRFAAFSKEWERFNYMLQPGYLGLFDLQCSPRGAKLERGERITDG
jgi:DNA polymerase-3 subunit alpha